MELTGFGGVEVSQMSKLQCVDKEWMWKVYMWIKKE